MFGENFLIVISICGVSKDGRKKLFDRYFYMRCIYRQEVCTFSGLRIDKWQRNASWSSKSTSILGSLTILRQAVYWSIFFKWYSCFRLKKYANNGFYKETVSPNISDFL